MSALADNILESWLNETDKTYFSWPLKITDVAVAKFHNLRVLSQDEDITWEFTPEIAISETKWEWPVNCLRAFPWTESSSNLRSQMISDLSLDPETRRLDI